MNILNKIMDMIHGGDHRMVSSILSSIKEGKYTMTPNPRKIPLYPAGQIVTKNTKPKIEVSPTISVIISNVEISIYHLSGSDRSRIMADDEILDISQRKIQKIEDSIREDIRKEKRAESQKRISKIENTLNKSSIRNSNINKILVDNDGTITRK